jgi:hypothetical protein
MREMMRSCGRECQCRQDLDSAVTGLERSSRLLSAFVFAEPNEMIETYYAAVRASELKLKGAMAAYRDHLLEV